MRSDKFFFLCKYIALISLSVFLYIPVVKANPVVAPQILWSTAPLLCLFFVTFLFLIGTLIEYFYLKYSLSKKDSSQTTKNKVLFFSILKINLVTFPLTQVLAYFVSIFASMLFWVLIIFIEILVIIIEWQFFKREFFRIYERNFVSKNILKDTSVANLISFFFGLIGFIFL